MTIIKNDDLTIEALRPFLPHFSCVVVGPGPGSPDKPKDIGVVRDLWQLKEDVLPIFGVCLGLQSLAIENGATLKRLNTVKHGLISDIHHKSTNIFDAVGSIKAVRYHSLHVELKPDGDIEELAWTHDEENGKVIMGIRHRHRPFWAVQYHPESVCTEGGGIQVVRNFWKLAQDWARRNGRRSNSLKSTIPNNLGHPWPYNATLTQTSSIIDLPSVLVTSPTRLGLSTVEICEAFGASEESSNFVFLESAAEPGRFSIIGCVSPSTLQIKYRIGDTSVCLIKDGRTCYEALGPQDIWAWLAIFIHSRKAINGNPDIPFWGGLIGCLSYELGVHSMHVPVKRTAKTSNKHPDVNFVFVERSIVLDKQTGRAYVQTIAPNDCTWLSEAVALLEGLPSKCCGTSKPVTSKVSITLPDKTRYISRIEEAKEHLFAGESYELCLTAQTRVSIPPTPSPHSSTSWERYKILRKNNPAPHSAYLRLHPTTLLSSSPERFLSFTRNPGSVCQLRPIKGTVRKTLDITREMAEKALADSPKEVAENLMIVDLIRHDLHGVVGEDVTVKQFCSVEEYETVWQLVSVIEGKLDQSSISHPDVKDQLGWRVLKQCLPPGGHFHSNEKNLY